MFNLMTLLTLECFGVLLTTQRVEFMGEYFICSPIIFDHFQSYNKTVRGFPELPPKESSTSLYSYCFNLIATEDGQES